jgi:hypothetical protein
MSFNGEYLLVYSATDKKVGDHIDDIMKEPRFRDKKENLRTRIIWVVDTCKKKPEEFSDEWPVESDKKNPFPDKCFVNGSGFSIQGKRPPVAAKFNTDIFDPKKLDFPEHIKEKLVSAILFSDGEQTDNKLPLLIGLLKKIIPPITIAAEFNLPENEECLWTAGADEVFNREVLLNNIMALNVLNPRNKAENSETETRITDFISKLVHIIDKPALGMRSAYMHSLRLNFPGENPYTPNWEKLLAAARAEKIRLLALFRKKNGDKPNLEPLPAHPGIHLKNGDCLLLLTHPGDGLSQFENEIYDPGKGIFREQDTYEPS